MDLTLDGATWQNVREWCAHYGADFDAVWPVIRALKPKLHDHA